MFLNNNLYILNNRLCIFPSLNLPFPLFSTCLMESPNALRKCQNKQYHC